MQFDSTTEFLNMIHQDLVKRGVIKAADPFTTSGLTSGGTKREQAQAFINQVVDTSELLKLVRVHPTDSPAGDISKLNITGYVTELASENEQGTNTRRPTNTSIAYSTTKTRSMIDITGEVLEDNVEGPGGRNTIMTAMNTAVGNDMETLGIEGDSSLSGSTDEERLKKSNDGWHVLTGADDGTGIVDAGNKRTSYKLLTDMIRTMPIKWKRPMNRKNLRFLMSENAAQDLVDEWAARSTTFGDRYRETGEIGAISGVKVEIIPMIPEDLALTGTDSTGTFIWLCDPKNFIWVVQRKITVEWERVPRYDRDECTIFMRTDFLVEEPTAVVKAENVIVDTSGSYYGA